MVSEVPITFLSYSETPVVLQQSTVGVERVHRFDQRSVDAVNAALGAGRPLLIRGEPGVGKTQLAEAAAEALDRAFLRRVVDARTESRDLLYEFDGVARLAEAQLCSAASVSPEEARNRLAVSNFVVPGPLWWALNTKSASEQCKTLVSAQREQPVRQGRNEQRYKNGWVVLIDEIDKAESDVPNGLLEALGAAEFTPPGASDLVRLAEDVPAPLIVLTTNEERELPDAFLRRCAILTIALPEGEDALRQHLVDIGHAHFPKMKATVLEAAATCLVQDRTQAKSESLKPLPGQAEFLDLLRAVDRRYPGKAAQQEQAIQILAKYIIRKPAEMQAADLRSDQKAER